MFFLLQQLRFAHFQESREMAWNDSSHVARALQPDLHDPEFISKGHPGQKPPPEPCRSAAALARTACCVLGDLRKIPQCVQHLGPLGHSGTVLVDTQVFHQTGAIMPQPGRDMWTGNFVKLPCSPSNTIYQHSAPESRWGAISNQLKGLVMKKTVNARDVEKAILKYNPKYKDQWSFDALAEFFKVGAYQGVNIGALVQKIAALALDLPERVMKGIPLLQQGRAAAITLSQAQISCLLANAFFCTFPHRNSTSFHSDYHTYPSINFTRLFSHWSERKMEKLKAIVHYFQVATDEKTKLDGLVTFERRCLANTDARTWSCCKEEMNKLYVSSCAAIETEGSGLLQVDFASSWLGGGVLDSGLLQEEILFLMNPELIVSRLFTEKLQDNECVIVTGCQQFSTYSGYGDTFRWKGPYADPTGRDGWARRQRQVLAMDALRFTHGRDQYSMKLVVRELNKAYCGFKRREEERRGEEPDIATGKWGCGAFKGDPQLKAVIQLMAAARAGRGLAFFTFRDEKLEHGLRQAYRLLRTKGTTVEQLYGLLADYCAIQQTSDTFQLYLFDFIRNCLCPEVPSKSQL